MAYQLQSQEEAEQDNGDKFVVPESVEFPQAHNLTQDPNRSETSFKSSSTLLHEESMPSSARSPSLKRLDFLRRHPSHRSCGGVRHMTHDQGKVSRIISSGSAPEVGAQSGIEDGPSAAVMLSAMALCANSIVGAGTLAVPFMMSLTGVTMYHVIVVLVCVANAVSLYWLVDVAEKLPEDVPANYEGIAHHFLGGHADAIISAAMVFGGFALTMAYMLFIATTLTSVLVTANVLSGVTEKAIHMGVLFGAGLCCVLPLTLLNDISRLRWTSATAVFILACTTIYVMTSSSLHLQRSGIHRGVVSSKVSFDIFDAIPMSVGAYACQILVLPIYDSLGPQRTPKKMGIVLAGGLTLATIVYEGVGIMGYLQFGDSVKSNILQNLDGTRSSSILSVAVSAGMALTLIFHVPLIVWPLRSCLISAYHATFDFSPAVEEDPTGREWIFSSVLIMIGVLTMAALFPEIKTALSVVGSIGGACIVFIYPAAFHLAVVKQLPPRNWFHCEHVGQLSMMLIGLVLGVLCFTMAIRNSMSE